MVFGPRGCERHGVHGKNVSVALRRKPWREREQIKLESLILAQIERWRHALHMQVERQRALRGAGEWRTGEERIGTCPGVGDNYPKG